MPKRPIRIANFSGYFGDRFTAIDEAMGGDPFDVLMGDYLAEVTLASLSTRYRADPTQGYVEYFCRQIDPHLAEIARRGIKVVTNAGGFNPAALAAVLRQRIAELGVDLVVAHIEGDNIYDSLDALQAAGHELRNLDSGEPMTTWGHEPIAANAYLGGWGIARALGAGADIVICGRVTDASLTLGPAAWWHDWASDDWDALAGAVAAGHIIECGAHAVGGNFSGFLEVSNFVTPGFPIAEVAADGSSVITKHARDEGEVTVDTVTAQILYEIQGPDYLNPDVTLNIDSIELTQLAPDRVQVHGVTGGPPPPTTKVAIFAPIGYQTAELAFVTAPQVEQKVELLRAQVSKNMPDDIDQLVVTTLGVAADDPETQWEATVTVRFMATAKTTEALGAFNLAGRLNSLYLSSIPGYYRDGALPRTSDPMPRIDYWPGLLDMNALRHEVVKADGERIAIEAPQLTHFEPQPSHPEPTPESYAVTDLVTVELGELAFARSGDKGGNSNVGLWTRDKRAWPWLRQALTTDDFYRLVPDTKGIDIVRHEFPNLGAVHFLLKGLLGTGGSSNLRADQIGKAIGEYVRAKKVQVPRELL
ncbi:MAG: acyclic terpene utilization AtuA family protein [Antricoccus sp.]